MKRFWYGVLTGVALCSVLILTGIPGITRGTLQIIDDNAVARWQAARLAFLSDAAFLACATEKDLRQAAEARGWEVETVNLATEQIPERLDDATFAIRIHVRPPMPLDKDPGDIEGFDDRGCLMR